MLPTSSIASKDAEALSPAREAAMRVVTSSGNKVRIDEMVREGVMKMLAAAVSRNYRGVDILTVDSDNCLASS